MTINGRAPLARSRLGDRVEPPTDSPVRDRYGLPVFAPVCLLHATVDYTVLYIEI